MRSFEAYIISERKILFIRRRLVGMICYRAGSCLCLCALFVVAFYFFGGSVFVAHDFAPCDLFFICGHSLRRNTKLFQFSHENASRVRLNHLPFIDGCYHSLSLALMFAIHFWLTTKSVYYMVIENQNHRVTVKMKTIEPRMSIIILSM